MFRRKKMNQRTRVWNIFKLKAVSLSSRFSCGARVIFQRLKGTRKRGILAPLQEIQKIKKRSYFVMGLKKGMAVPRLSLEKMTGKRKLAVGVVTAMVAIGGVFLYFQTRVGATNYDWLQASWLGGQDQTNYPRHGQDTPGLPKQNWTKFFSKDAQIDTSNNEIKITQTDTNWTETDDASGFSAGTKSNTYSSGTGFLLKKNNGVTCTAGQNQQCTSDNCDADFNNGSSYCHATASSCAYFALGTPWERANGYEQCSGNSYYKSCANSVWGAQQNSPDAANDYCDAGGGAQSGYDLLATCASGASGGFTNPACTSCSPYIAASTSSCKTTCASVSDCWSGYGCSGGVCVPPCSASTACGTSCAFNGLVYGSVTADNKCWMDRNLGATAVATARDTAASYGGYYQWGRKTNEHQVSNSGTSITQFSTYTQDPTSGGLFIKGFTDWLNPQNNTLWAAANGYLNNPCPTGWHVPAQAEWSSVVSTCGITNYTTAINNNCSGFALPASGYRDQGNASLSGQGTYGYYRSSDPTGSNAFLLRFYSSGVNPADSNIRALGFSVRCLKN